MARFYSNENFPRRAVEALRSLGHDVLTSLEAGRANQRIPDPEVLAYATELGRAVLTLNRRDFVQLHAENGQHAGIVVCTVDTNSAALAQRIHQGTAALASLGGELLRITKENNQASKK